MFKRIYVILIYLCMVPCFAHVTVFNNVSIIDGTGSNFIAKGALIIDGSKIKMVSKSPLKLFPHNATVIDLTGKTIMPAMIAAHTHLGLIKGTTTTDANNTPDNVRAQLKRYASYGVGTVLSLGRDQKFIYELRKTISGPYASILTAGQGFGVPNAMPPSLHDGYDPVYRPSSPEQVPDEMKALVKNHPDLVKFWLDDWYGTMPKMNPAIYRAVIRQAHRYHLPVAAHIFYLADAKAVVHDGTNILAHSIRDKEVDKDLIATMIKKHVALIPTLQLDEAYFIYKEKPDWMFTPFFKNALEPGVWDQLMNSSYTIKESEKKYLATAQKNLKILFDAGIPIAFGSDSGAIPTRAQGFAEHRELQLMVEAGLTPAQVLYIATGGTAKILKIDNLVGTLKPGKRADFIILDANPLKDIKNTQKISAVWLRGIKIAGTVQ